MRKLISRECGGPAVWSTDSRYLAVPVFVDRTDQKLAIVDAATGEIRLLPESVMLLTLKSFDGKTVVGIKWKVNGEQPVSIDITSLIKR